MLTVKSQIAGHVTNSNRVASLPRNWINALHGVVSHVSDPNFLPGKQWRSWIITDRYFGHDLLLLKIELN